MVDVLVGYFLTQKSCYPIRTQKNYQGRKEGEFNG
jgi:hypothetical protein